MPMAPLTSPVRRGPGDEAVGLDHQLYVGGFDRHDQLVEPEALQTPDVFERALGQRLGRRRAVFCGDLPFQRPAVDAHAHRHAQPRAGAGDGAHAVVVPDVAGVDADFRDSGFGRVNRELIIEMDVRHQRQRRML